MKKTEKKHINSDILIVEVDYNEEVMRWWLEDKNNDVTNYGYMDIEVYTDNSWLPYEETHCPSPYMPHSLEPEILELCKKLGLKKILQRI